jgi:protein-disulfide isomerase
MQASLPPGGVFCEPFPNGFLKQLAYSSYNARMDDTNKNKADLSLPGSKNNMITDETPSPETPDGNIVNEPAQENPASYSHAAESDNPRPIPTVNKRAIRRMQLKKSASIGAGWFAWLALPMAFLLGLGMGWLTWGQGAAAPTVADNQVTIPADAKRYDVPTDGDPSIGPENAPITLIEFSDYQCPYCVRWYDEVYSRLLNDYKDQIRFVYRDFPLNSIHPEAQSAAEAANCAGEQNFYWQYHDALFGAKNGLGSAAYTQYASDLGLNMDQFKKCVSERRYKVEVDADLQAASGLGVSSTPTFFLNGLAIVGAQPYEVFKQVIDKELAAKATK